MLPRPQTHSKALGPGVTGPDVHLPEPPVCWQRPLNSAQHPSCGSAPFLVDPAALSAGNQHTQMPYVTGTSVLAMKYQGGVLIACDTLGAYGKPTHLRVMTQAPLHTFNDHHESDLHSRDSVDIGC